MPAPRLTLFIDARNLYHTAGNSFFNRPDPGIYGQIDPMALGRMIADRDRNSPILHEVWIYTGRPESAKDPRSYSAHMKQCSAWINAGATVIPRTLKYPHNWPAERAQEKGIDVALAVDYVTLAVENMYGIGVIASTYSDLLPALEYVYSLGSRGGPQAAVMAWSSTTGNPRLSIPGAHLWCHWFNKSGFDSISDPTNYAL